MDTRTRRAIDWLASSPEPAIRRLAARDLRGEPASVDDDAVRRGPKVAALLSGQHPDGSFGVHPYRKWTGAHWRLVSLVELGVAPGDSAARRAAETVLDWLTSEEHRSGITTVAGLFRSHASQEGNALAVACSLGMAEDRRARLLADSLLAWQWPDGGWNCDPAATGRRSSFHETLPAVWGLHEFARVTGSKDAAAAAGRAAELFLEHRLYRALGSGEPIRRSWLALHYPPYWHYDILQCLLVLSRLGRAGDDRCGDALDVLEGRRLGDGRWRPGGYWWNPPGSGKGTVEVVDWGRSAPNEMITLNALRVLQAAGRLDDQNA